MEYYFIDFANEQKGPVYKSELLKYGVSKDTLVWKEGMPQWTAAGKVQELNDLFMSSGSIPPPAPPTYGASNQGGNYTNSRTPPPIFQDTKPDSLLVWSILSTLFCCIPLGVVAIVYSTKVDSLWNAGDVQGAYRAASNAKLYCLLSLGLGIVWMIIAFFGGIFSAIAGI